MNEPCNSLDQNAEHETRYLLKLIASLEACNKALLNKLDQAQMNLATLRQSQVLQGMEPTGEPEQLHTWERKLRMGWRPP